MEYWISPRDFPWAQAIFHRIPLLSSQYSYNFNFLCSLIASDEMQGWVLMTAALLTDKNVPLLRSRSRNGLEVRQDSANLRRCLYKILRCYITHNISVHSLVDTMWIQLYRPADLLISTYITLWIPMYSPVDPCTEPCGLTYITL